MIIESTSLVSGRSPSNETSYSFEISSGLFWYTGPSEKFFRGRHNAIDDRRLRDLLALALTFLTLAICKLEPATSKMDRIPLPRYEAVRYSLLSSLPR